MDTPLVTQFTVDGFDQNFTYICTDPDSDAAVVVDPAGDITEVLTDITNQQKTITAVWLTHTHPDHYDALPALIEHTGTLPIYVHEAGAARLRNQGFAVTDIYEGSQLRVGTTTWQVLHTPGHSPDGCCFYHASSASQPPYLISGDTLFVRGCGRTTPTEAQTLFHSLQRLQQLPGEAIVFPGHDYGPTPTSTIASEQQYNPYLQASDLETFLQVRFPNA